MRNCKAKVIAVQAKEDRLTLGLYLLVGLVLLGLLLGVAFPEKAHARRNTVQITEALHPEQLAVKGDLESQLQRPLTRKELLELERAKTPDTQIRFRQKLVKTSQTISALGRLSMPQFKLHQDLKKQYGPLTAEQIERISQARTAPALEKVKRGLEAELGAKFSLVPGAADELTVIAGSGGGASPVSSADDEEPIKFSQISSGDRASIRLLEKGLSFKKYPPATNAEKRRVMGLDSRERELAIRSILRERELTQQEDDSFSLGQASAEDGLTGGSTPALEDGPRDAMVAWDGKGAADAKAQMTSVLTELSEKAKDLQQEIQRLKAIVADSQ